jgi:hypothetical protein
MTRAELFAEFPVDGPSRNDPCIRGVEGYLLVVGPKSDAKTLRDDLTALEVAEIDLSNKKASRARLIPIDVVIVEPSMDKVHRMLGVTGLKISDAVLENVFEYLWRESTADLKNVEPSDHSLLIRVEQELEFARGIALEAALADEEDEDAEAEEGDSEPWLANGQSSLDSADHDDEDSVTDIDSEDTSEPELLGTFRSVEIVGPSVNGQPGLNYCLYSVEANEDKESKEEGPNFQIRLRVERIGGLCGGPFDYTLIDSLLEAAGGPRLPKQISHLEAYDSDGGLFSEIAPGIMVGFRSNPQIDRE